MTKTFDNPQIVVLDRGFVYAGRAEIADGFVTITKAQCVRRWGTSKGLGELAAEGPKARTVLDDAGTVVAPVSAIVHLIGCNAAVWPHLAA
jgi:hypothetical protein